MTSMTSAMKNAALAAAALLASAGTIFYDHGTGAQAAKPAALTHSVPGHITEMIAPTATITSTVHYQAQLDLDCFALVCGGSFPNAGSKRQLNITRIACFIQALSENTTFTYGEIQLRSSADAFLLRETLPADFSSPRKFSLNRAVDLQLVGGQHMYVYLEIGAGASYSTCTATGTLSTLG